MKRKILVFALLLGLLSSCEQLLQVAKEIDQTRPLTEQEVVSGLKQALKIGVDSAASRLAATNGYYLDNTVRIGFPPEARVITDNISYLPGGQALVEDIIFRINRAAEDAAREAAPVFGQAIANMTISDGFYILRGDDNAATQYLKMQTYPDLYRLYHPKIKNSTEKPIVGNMSTINAWNSLTRNWNSVATSAVGRMAGLSTVDVELDEYLTELALDGLFLKLAEQEEKIRHDPAARVTELLRRIFE